MTDLYPMLIAPRFDERIWGGHNLARMLGKAAPPDKSIGESWEVYEENQVLNGLYAGHTIGELRQSLGANLLGHVDADTLFPLLTKLIDAQDVLSVQVHPDDNYAREHLHQPYGKTECWYIIHADPGAELIYGFNRDSSPEEYEKLVADGSLDTILRKLPVQAGDVVYLPARVVHAIGGGIVLFELQQTSDVTYRIYDWNRKDANGKPRELHVQEALQVLDYARWTRGKVHPLSDASGARAILIAGTYFCLELLHTDSLLQMSTYGSPVALCTLEFPARIRTGPHSAAEAVLAPFSSALVPAAGQTYTVLPDTPNSTSTRVLVAYVPESTQSTRRDLLDRGFSKGEVDAFLTQFAPVER